MTEKDKIASELARLDIGELSPEDQQSMAMLVINNGTAADAIIALPNVTNSNAAAYALAWFIEEKGTSRDVQAAINALPNVTNSNAASELAVFIRVRGTSGDVQAVINALPNVTHRDAAFALAWFICDNGTPGNVGAVNALLELEGIQLPTRTRQKLVSFVADKTKTTPTQDTDRKPIPGTLRQQALVPQGIPRGTRLGNRDTA